MQETGDYASASAAAGTRTATTAYAQLVFHHKDTAEPEPELKQHTTAPWKVQFVGESLLLPRAQHSKRQRHQKEEHREGEGGRRSGLKPLSCMDDRSSANRNLEQSEVEARAVRVLRIWLF